MTENYTTENNTIEYDPQAPIEVDIEGKRHRFTLKLASARRDLLLRMDSDIPADPIRAIRRQCLVLSSTLCLEGHEKFPLTLAEAIERDHLARKKLLAARAKYVDHARNKGMCFLQCPHCQSGGIEIDLFMMFLVHGAMPHPVTNPDQSPSDPFMAYLGFELDFWPLLRTHLFRKRAVAHALVKGMEATRDTLGILGAYTPPTRDYRIPPAKSARVSLPSRIAGAFEEKQVDLLLKGPVLPTHDLEAVLRWGDYSLGPTNENDFWDYVNPGFRTLLRLAMITSHPDGKTEFGPEILETWPVSDILFLDTLYAYLHSMSTTNPERGAVRCMGCGKEFLAAL